MFHKNPIVDIRFSQIGDGAPVLEILRASPVGDASGAICGFKVDGTWEQVCTVHFDDPVSYRSYSDLEASGGIVDAP